MKTWAHVVGITLALSTLGIYTASAGAAQHFLQQVGSDYYTLNVDPALSTPEKAEVGKKGVDLEGTDATGRLIKLSDYAGKVILLDLSTTWCGACVESAPEVNALYEKHKDQGLVCITCLLNADKLSQLEQWTKEGKLTMPVIKDDKGKEGNSKFYLNATKSFVPTFVVLDKDFVVQFVKAGKLDQAKRAVAKCIKK